MPGFNLSHSIVSTIHASKSNKVMFRSVSKTQLDKNMNSESEKNMYRSPSGSVLKASPGPFKRMVPRSVFDLKSRAAGIGLVFLLVTGTFTIFYRFDRPWMVTKDGCVAKEAVVFDGGSTGTRLNLFRFCDLDGRLKLDGHVFMPVKPGLSSYAESPTDAATSLNSLLARAEEEVPRMRRRHTPVALWATAGLRLLPGHEADIILQSVQDRLDNSGFSVRPGAVKVIDGMEEGYFAWVTVNFVLERLDRGSVGTVDLGGGSVQITFEPSNPKKTFQAVPISYKKEVTLFNSMKKLYVHSYLGKGLMAARYALLGGDNNTKSGDTLYSSCFPKGAEEKWSYANKKFSVKHGDGAKLAHCHDLATSLVKDTHKPWEVKRRTFILMSYFFDRAAEIGLVDEKEGGTIQVGAFREEAKKECASPSKERPFMCLDLSYMAAFLIDGLGFLPTNEVMVKNNIKGVEANWALGAAFSLLR